MANGDPIEVESGQTPQSVLARRRLAETMIKMGMDTSPIQSWTQGAARMLNSTLGNYDLYKLEQKEDADRKDSRAFSAGQYGLTPSPSSSPQFTPSTGAAPLPQNKADLGNQIYDFWKTKGMSDKQAAALAGNAVWEGGGRTDLVNPGDNWRNSPNSPHSAGIGQWNDRLPALFKYASDNGIEVPAGNMRDANYVRAVIAKIPLETQLGFANQEMQGPEGRALAMLKASPDDLVGANKGAISYNRPAGWTPSNPAGGHGFSGRLQLADSILRAQAARQAQNPPTMPVGTPDLGGQGPSPIPGVVLSPTVPGAPSPFQGVPPASVTGAPSASIQTPPAVTAPPQAPAMGLPGPPQAPPAAMGQPPAAMQPPQIPGPVAAPAVSRQDMMAQAWSSLGPRAEAVQKGLLSGNATLAAAAKAEIDAAVARVQSAQLPNEPQKLADLSKTQAQAAESKSKLPKEQAEAAKAQAELDAALGGRPSPTKYAEELGKTQADIRKDAQTKAEGAVEFLSQSDAARKLIEAKGHVIGRFAAPSEHGSEHSSVMDVLMNPTEIGARMMKGARDLHAGLGGSQDPTGLFAANNQARDELSQAFTKLAQAGLKATYGARITNIDVGQQAKTVPQLTDQNSDTSISKLNTIEDQSWRSIQHGLNTGAITTDQLRDMPPEVLLRGIKEGKLKIESPAAGANSRDQLIEELRKAQNDPQRLAAIMQQLGIAQTPQPQSPAALPPTDPRQRLIQQMLPGQGAQ